MIDPEGRDGHTPYQVIAPDGTARVSREDMGLKDEDLRAMLRWMILARAVDDAAMALQAAGELTVYPPFRGQEAAQIGSAFALARDDWIFPSFREMAAALVRGIDPVEYLHYHRGTWHGGPYDPMRHHFAPICVTLANQLPHAVGFAMGTRLDGKRTVTLAYFGDGAASEGDFHEAANFAGVFNAPVIFFCQNNRWAISVPLEEQTAAPIYLRAAGYGFPGEHVDGNDVVAVWQATHRAIGRARAGDGPTLIEAMTYRLGPHTTNVPSAAYRSPKEVERWARLDPIARLRAYLLNEGVVAESQVQTYESEAAGLAATIIDQVRVVPPYSADDLFPYVFERPSAELHRQWQSLVREAGEPGG